MPVACGPGQSAQLWQDMGVWGAREGHQHMHRVHHCDKIRRTKGFCGKRRRSGSYSACGEDTRLLTIRYRRQYYKNVKADEPFFDSAIFLIRTPYLNLLSNNFARKKTGSNHIKYMDKHDSTMVVLHSTLLYITPPWLYFTVLDSTLLYHCSTSLYFTTPS